MQRIGSLPQKTRTRTFDAGPFRGYTDYLIEGEPGAMPSPQAYLVHQAPNHSLPTHFHREEQFQVVVGGSGKLGAHAIEPLTVHYTSRESAYGPIVAGADGLDYLTLRAVTDAGARYLPEARGELRIGLRKHHAMARARLEPQGPAHPVGCQALLEPATEGAGAWLLRLASSAQVATPPQAASGGRFHVVIEGEWTGCGAVPLGPMACVWTDAAEPPLRVQAGAHGLVLLVVQFPASAVQGQAQDLRAAKSPAAG